MIFPQTKENHNEVILKAFLSLLPISLSLVNRLRCQQTSSSNHSFKGLLTISSILKVGYHFIWPYQVLFFSLWFVLDLQPRKCTLSFPSTKILLLFALNFFFSIFFLPYDSLPCSFYILFLRWYLSPLQPATFIDDKMEAYLFHPFETNKGSVKSDVKKKKKSHLYLFGIDSLLHLWISSPVLFLGLTVFWSVSLVAVTCSLTLSHSQWFGSKSEMNKSWRTN